MKRRAAGYGWAAVLAIGLLLCAAVRVMAARPATSEMYSQLIEAEVKGFVFYTDGRTPAAKVPVRVWDVRRREFIIETETNEYGFYSLPRLEPGEYYLTYDWTRLRIQIIGEHDGDVQQPHHVVVVIPRDVGFVAIPQMSAALFATTLSEMSRQYEEERDRPVSP
ncbi:MAG: carboxypeptidase regulatory-like domain-containing protein [Phycisphaerae bacterium]|nr:carboxypeptidase regulatory-like domain-containing protein [Phycisphaerae bacterium]